MPDPVLDPAQQAAATALAALLDRRGRPLRPGRGRPSGVYLHGRPGRGKTMLMDRFFAATVSEHKRRVHFHRFFAELSDAVRVTGSMRAAVDTVVGDVRVLCERRRRLPDAGRPALPDHAHRGAAAASGASLLDGSAGHLR